MCIVRKGLKQIRAADYIVACRPCNNVKTYLKQEHRFKGADSRSASHIHRANHYPRKNGKAQQNRNAADRHLLPLYRKARTRRSRLNPQNGIGRTVETARPTYRVPPIRS